MVSHLKSFNKQVTCSDSAKVAYQTLWKKLKKLHFTMWQAPISFYFRYLQGYAFLAAKIRLTIKSLKFITF